MNGIQAKAVETCLTGRRGGVLAFISLCFALMTGVASSAPVVGNSVEVASGLIARRLDVRGGRVLGESYRGPDGADFMHKGSPEFAFKVDGRMYSDATVWKELSVSRDSAADGSSTTHIGGVSPDGRFSFELAYTTYPGLALVRKTLSVENKGEKEFFISDVDVETFRIGNALDCTDSRTLRRFARCRAEGPYIGDWNDPLIVVHDYARRRGMAIGNEAVSVLKRTTVFQHGEWIVSGMTHSDEKFPFKRRLKPGEKWTAPAVFTAPYGRCDEPQRIVEGPVADYIRKYMGVRVEKIPQKPMFVYNTWNPFQRNINAQLIMELADAAAECGIEEFVIDDGWQMLVSDGKFGYGDWEVDSKKFPQGLKPVFDHIRAKGMRPGLWLSLAWVGPTAAPLRDHPEWFVKDKDGKLADLHQPGARNRTACMATPWREYIKGKILGLVRDHGLAYVKLDLAIATSAYVHDDAQTGCYATDHPGHAGHEDSYAAIFESCMKLFDELHEAAPDLFIDCTFETAGRLFLMDYGIAKHAEGNWLSNLHNTPQGLLELRRLAWERSAALPASSLVIGNMSMNGGEHALAFKSLAGTLPIMLGDPRKLSAAERAEYREWASWLKKLEARHGCMAFRQDLPGFGYPCECAWDGFARINTETKSGGFVGVFRQNSAEEKRRVTVRGLSPAAKYAVLKGADGSRVAELTGRELEDAGFEAVLAKRCDGELYEIVCTDAQGIPRPKAVREADAIAGVRGVPVVGRAVPGEPLIWVEAENFTDRGAWKVDTQFTHKMGSAYLIAPGLCKPIGSAKTTVDVPCAGTWHVWARTKDWLPEFSPGQFAISVNGKRGAVLGASKREGWRWEKAGVYELPQGAASLSLDDLSGAYARCDAILFTTDAAYVPPENAEELADVRRRFLGIPDVVEDCGEYDVVVIGAGSGGMGASIAAARTGAKTALVHDRPVLGGNSSTELGVTLDGAAGSHPNRKTDMRETGICEEASLLASKEKSLSGAYRVMVDAEPNLTEFKNRRVLSVEKDGDRISAVVARDTLTGRMSRYRGKIFIDCTGDGWVGVFAGAERMYGREAKSEYGEVCAPDKRDDLTMSGCLMNGYLAYRYEMRNVPVAYEAPKWADVLPPGFSRRIWTGLKAPWWLEHGGRFDDLADPERARDELVRIVFAYWGWVKNKSPLREQAAKAELVEVPYMNARREGYRLVGDYVLTGTDALDGKMFPDRISYGGWPLDTHDPLGMDNPRGDGYWKHHSGVPTYTIPYRCLYSRNIPNLMFAGRCVSVTHVALGSVRVQATLFTLGQAAGTAAARASALGLSPREYGKERISELQQTLLKDDQYIPGVKNEDPLDLARNAKVTATSYDKELGALPEGVIDGISRQEGKVYHGWASDRNASLPQTIRLDFAKPSTVREVRLTFDTDLTPWHPQINPYPKKLVKSYRLEGFDGKDWRVLADVKENPLRHRIHRFAPCRLEAIRVTVTETWGFSCARIFEVRCY